VEVRKEDMEDEESVLELEEECPLTCFAHLEMASSSLAAIAPMRPPATDEEDELDTDSAENNDGGRSCSGSISPRYISSWSSTLLVDIFNSRLENVLGQQQTGCAPAGDSCG